MYKAPIHYTAQHKATAVHNGKYVPGGEREGAQTWNFMNHISLSLVRMQMPTHKLTVQVLDNIYVNTVRAESSDRSPGGTCQDRQGREKELKQGFYESYFFV